MNTAPSHCDCELVDEEELRELYDRHARFTQGRWHGPLPLDEWKDQYLVPAGGASAPEVDLTSVSVKEGQSAFVRVSIACTL